MHKCLYCGKETSEKELHLQCPICDNGMCQECYDKDKGTEEQVWDIDELDNMEEGFYSFVMSKSNGCTQLICYKCLEDLDVEFRKTKEEK